MQSIQGKPTMIQWIAAIFKGVVNLQSHLKRHLTKTFPIPTKQLTVCWNIQPADNKTAFFLTSTVKGIIKVMISKVYCFAPILGEIIVVFSRQKS